MRYIKLLSVGALLCVSSLAQAQVFVRVPFVRVYADGPYWSVRAPFVNIGSAPPPVYVAPTAPVPAVQTAPPAAVTLDDFAKTFVARPGTYTANLRNPVTGQPTIVNFTLPDGSPRQVSRDSQALTFDYGLRHFVKIEFDKDGATVVSR
jgi:hypothetical protein